MGKRDNLKVYYLVSVRNYVEFLGMFDEKNIRSYFYTTYVPYFIISVMSTQYMNAIN